MKQLLCSLFVVLLIVACKDNPVDVKKEFEPYRIGSFMMTSPKSAEFVGSSSKSKVDTSVVTDPEGYGMELWDDSTFSADPAVAFRFVDSTITLYESVDVHLRWTNNDWSLPLSIRSISLFGTPIIEMEGYFASPCNFDINTNLEFRYFSGDTLSRVTIVKTDGIVQAGKEILGC